MIDGNLRVVGIGGTTRSGSSTEKALRVTLDSARRAGADTVLFSGHDLGQLPMYAPESSERDPVARRMVDAIAGSDGLVVASPGYHGALSGLVKNALDYIEDLRQHEPPYLTGRAVGCIATGAGWQATASTLQSLRFIVHALRGWPTPLGAAVNTATSVFDDDGRCVNDKAAFQLRTVGEEVVTFCERWRC